MTNASLDDFGDGEAADDGGDPGDGRSPGGRTGGGGSAPTEAPPVTYAWSPSGVACGACGSTVERRWRDGERMVCRDCKSW